MPTRAEIRHLEEQLRHTHQRALLLRSSMAYSSVSIFFVSLTILALFAEQVLRLPLDLVALPSSPCAWCRWWSPSGTPSAT